MSDRRLLVLCLALPLAACKGGSLTKAEDAELEALVYGGMGLGSIWAYFHMLEIDLDATVSISEGEPCPQATLEGDTLRLKAVGCTGPASGYQLEGEVQAKNVPLLALPNVMEMDGFGTNPDTPMSLRFDDWSAIDPDGTTTALDGGYQSSSQGCTGACTSSSDLWVETNGRPGVRRTDSLSCEDGACTPTEPVILELDGFGSFEVEASGMDLVGGVFTGDLVIIGEQTLTVDLDSLNAMGCMKAEVEGEERVVCLDELMGMSPGTGDGFSNSLIFYSFGLGVMSDFVDIEAYMSSTWGVVEVTADVGVLSAQDIERHPLALTGQQDGLDTWQLDLESGAFEPGLTTALDLSGGYDDVAALLRAYDGDGALLGCALMAEDREAALALFDWSDCAR